MPLTDDYKNTRHDNHRLIGIISRWLKALYIIILIFGMPSLWFFGYISNTYINRLGIILNFLAGFMIAPELIGKTRLQSIEIAIGNRLNNTKEWSSSFLHSYSKTLVRYGS